MSTDYYDEFEYDEYGDAYDNIDDENMQQNGGNKQGKHCCLCGSVDTNMINCPLNRNAKHKSYKNHPLCKLYKK